MAVLILDLDNFKLVNKAMGHAAGDDLLKIVARSLSNCLRETDTAARLGGDEFGVLLTNLQDELDAGGIAAKIVDTLSRPLPVQGRAVHCSLSIGIATVPRNGDDSKDLLQQADTAMRHAKKQGRNRIEFFAEEMNTLARRRVKLESGLRTAASDGTLQLHYQPIFDLRRGRMTGAEALIRWRHAELGALAPDEFLPLAEGTDLILEIGDWVLHTACQQAVRWQRMGHEGFRMAVNISPRQLQDPGFCDKIQRALLQSGLQAESLELEITERMLVGDAEDMLRALHEVKELGVHLSVDDFGTGYSALAYLKDLPIDVLKIDRSFTNSLMIDPAGATIVETIVRMAKGLNLTTVAEGVEQPDELLLLGSYGCNRIQGFLVGRPVAASDFAHWIDSPTLRWDHALTDDGE
jgi:diguanylate cyclase (GGDEF)-like protein